MDLFNVLNYMEDRHLIRLQAQLTLTGRQIQAPHLYLIDGRLF